MNNVKDINEKVQTKKCSKKMRIELRTTKMAKGINRTM